MSEKTFTIAEIQDVIDYILDPDQWDEGWEEDEDSEKAKEVASKVLKAHSNAYKVLVDVLKGEVKKERAGVSISIMDILDSFVEKLSNGYTLVS